MHIDITKNTNTFQNSIKFKYFLIFLETLTSIWAISNSFPPLGALLSLRITYTQDILSFSSVLPHLSFPIFLSLFFFAAFGNLSSTEWWPFSVYFRLSTNKKHRTEGVQNYTYFFIGALTQKVFMWFIGGWIGGISAPTIWKRLEELRTATFPQGMGWTPPHSKTGSSPAPSQEPASRSCPPLPPHPPPWNDGIVQGSKGVDGGSSGVSQQPFSGFQPLVQISNSKDTLNGINWDWCTN